MAENVRIDYGLLNDNCKVPKSTEMSSWNLQFNNYV